ncbi:hypothetical protein N9068_02015 [bacterium]|nr:hypothetical protein [bacterium]
MPANPVVVGSLLKGRVGVTHLLDAKVEEGSLSDHSAVVTKITLPRDSR